METKKFKLSLNFEIEVVASSEEEAIKDFFETMALSNEDTTTWISERLQAQEIEDKKKRVKKFIITDPCYIMNEKQYDDICRNEGYNFEGQKFPLASKNRDNDKDIIFHTIVGTPNGDGSYMFRGQDIGVDAGMLCIAECEDGWKATLGATFSSLKVAQNNLPNILKHF
jgi:hypothetical protein